MSVLKIHLSNDTYAEMPEASADNVEAITTWFHEAGPDQALRVNFPDQSKTLHIQKQHIVQIEAQL